MRQWFCAPYGFHEVRGMVVTGWISGHNQISMSRCHNRGEDMKLARIDVDEPFHIRSFFMIKTMTILKGLPGQGGSPIQTHSADGRGLGREGVVAEFRDEAGRIWVGNFLPAGSGGHHRFDNGTAVILAGPHAYAVRDQESAPVVVTSPGVNSVWSAQKAFVHQGKACLLLVGSGGFLACMGDRGEVIATDHLLEPCEDVQLDQFEAGKVTGSYYQFTTQKRLPFEWVIGQ